MFQYRQVLVRLRAGDSVREIARSALMGRDKLGVLRAVALQYGWLDAGAELPDDAHIAAAVSGAQPPQRASSTISSVQLHREVVRRWFDAGVQGRAIHTALKREHAFAGSYSAVVRMLAQLFLSDFVRCWESQRNPSPNHLPIHLPTLSGSASPHHLVRACQIPYVGVLLL